MVNGTATGILGSLPEFRSPSMTVTILSRIEHSQYLLKKIVRRISVAALCHRYFKCIRRSNLLGTAALLGAAAITSISIAAELTDRLKKVTNHTKGLKFLCESEISALNNPPLVKTEDAAFVFLPIFFH